MPFRVFLSYCCLWGAFAAMAGWLFGEWIGVPRSADSAARDVLPGLGLGVALAVVDAFSTRSSRHLLAAGWAAAAGAVLGALGGGLNGVLSDTFVDGGRGQGWQLLPWAIMGALIGAGAGVGDLGFAALRGHNLVMSILKIRNGIIGGVVGGLAGGGAVLGLRVLWPLMGIQPTEDLWTTTAAEQATYGGGVGLGVGLVQLLLKQAWLRVESVLGGGSNIPLSRAETSLGSAAEIELYPDAEVERVHASIRRSGSEYILSDTGTAAGTHVNDRRIDSPVALSSGDLIRIGRNTLLFLRR
jgi:hypothetical protein